MTATRRLALLPLALSLALLAPGVYADIDRTAALEEANLLLLPRDRTVPSIALVDLDGHAFDTASLQGAWHLVFFGFTFCPDICPTTLSEMRQLFERLPDDTRSRLKLVMVTADPARDTPERLKTYLGYFSRDFIGLTGEMPHLQRLSQAVGLPFVPPETGEPGYSVTHSANLALLTPEGRLHGFIRAPLKVSALERWLPQLIE